MGSENLFSAIIFIARIFSSTDKKGTYISWGGGGVRSEDLVSAIMFFPTDKKGKEFFGGLGVKIWSVQ